MCTDLYDLMRERISDFVSANGFPTIAPIVEFIQREGGLHLDEM